MRKLLLTLGMFLLAASVSAQVTIPYTFAPFTTISAAKFNANFAALGADALNRTGGALTGNLSVNAGVTIDGADISTYLLGDGKLAAPSLNDDALTVGGGMVIGTLSVHLVNTQGKIPGITSDYFASLDGSQLTGLPPGVPSGAIVLVNLGDGCPADYSEFHNGFEGFWMSVNITLCQKD